MKAVKIFVVFMCVFCLLPLSASISSASYYDNHSGTEEDPYLITSVSDFVEFRNRINEGSDPEGAYYKLNTASNRISIGSDTYKSWESIGTSYNPFTGHLDGNGHTVIVNINVNKEASLFGIIKTSSGYAVKNLTVSGTVKGTLSAGLVMNLYNASIENCTFTGTLIAETANNDYGDDTVSAGGIVQHMYSGTIKNCIVENTTITITPLSAFLSTNYVGGIAAIMDDGTVDGCIVRDSVTFGGADDEDGSSTVSIRAGGIVGMLKYGTVTNNESYASISFGYANTLHMGGIIGRIDEDYLKITGNIYSGTGWGIGYDLYAKASDEGCSKTGAGTKDEPIVIDSLSAFKEFCEKVNADSLYAAGMYFKLDTDLNIQDLECTPIGTEANPFTGHFDGGGHKITITRGAALFGTIKTTSSYAVKKLNVSGTFSGRICGGIVQNLYTASIESCTFTGTISAAGYNGLYDENFENIDSYAGGIAGHIYSGSIKDCTVTKAVITCRSRTTTRTLQAMSAASSAGWTEEASRAAQSRAMSCSTVWLRLS